VLAVSHHLFGRSAFLQVAWPIAAGVVTLERLIPRFYRDVPFLAVSQSSKDDLVRRGIAEGHIEIVHNGIRFPSVAAKPWNERRPRIAYLGRLEPYKRVDLLLRAVERLLPRFPELELVLIGRGSARVGLERLCAALGLSERTRFAGFVPDDERDALLADARVCACPSVKEGWGITVIEVNAVGTPVVATDAPGLRDAIRHGETGLLVADGPSQAFTARLADSIGELLADDALAQRLSRGALAWSRRFSWDATAERTAHAIDSLLARHRL
jgi:glycosyltransferase involved in cell wall biosynthesis